MRLFFMMVKQAWRDVGSHRDFGQQAQVHNHPR